MAVQNTISAHNYPHRSSCRACYGAGHVPDPVSTTFGIGTLADMVECPSCRGAGYVELLPLPNSVAHYEVEIADTWLHCSPSERQLEGAVRDRLPSGLRERFIKISGRRHDPKKCVWVFRVELASEGFSGAQVKQDLERIAERRMHESIYEMSRQDREAFLIRQIREERDGLRREESRRVALAHDYVSRDDIIRDLESVHPLPGSQDAIDLMSERAAAGEPLFKPQDPQPKEDLTKALGGTRRRIVVMEEEKKECSS